MRKHRLAPICAATVLGIALLTGCGEKPADTTEPKTEAAPNTNTEDTTTMTDSKMDPTETTEAPEVTPTPTEAPFDPEANWETGKVSGDIVDYALYFSHDLHEVMSPRKDQKGAVSVINYHSGVLNADRRARIYLPADYDETKTYPVVYMIHGIGCDDGQWVNMGIPRMFDNLIADGTLQPFIAVFPNVHPVNGLNPDTFSMDNIQAFTDFVQEFKEDLEPYLKETYHISDRKEDTAICGLSMGGMEALRVGFTYQDTFDYIGSFSAAPTLEVELLKVTGEAPKLVLVCSGDKDGVVGKNPYNYHMELTKNGVDHIWYQHPGGNHNDDVWRLGAYNFVTRLSGGFTAD